MDGYYSAKTNWILGSSFFCWGWNFLTDQYMDLVGRMDCGSQQNPTAGCSFCFLVFFVNANGILWLRGMGWCILFYPICGSVAAVCTPVFAALSWYTTQKGRVPSILRMGITSCMIFTSFRLGGRIFISDLALSFLMIILLFSKKSFLKRPHFNF